MAFELSARATLLKDKINVRQQIIVEIDGIDPIFGAVDVTELLRYDAGFNYDDPGIFYDGVVEHTNQRPYISLDKTTKRITQQLQQDKTASSSVSSVKINMIDKNGELTDLFTPGNYVDDILARRANVYLGFQGGAHPEDSIKIFAGLIDSIDFASGSVLLNIAHPEQLKRQTIFPLINTELSGAIDASQTTITVDSSIGLLLPFGVLTSFIRVEDEIIQYTGISGNNLTGCTRGALLTVASAHDDESEASSWYRLQEDPIHLALELLISGTGNFGHTIVDNFNQLTSTDYIQNAIYFSDSNIEDTLGLVVGDLASVSGTVSNNFVYRPISGFGTLDSGGSYIVIDEPIQPIYDETDAGGSINFYSIFDVLPSGCAINPAEIDVKQFQDIRDFFGANFPDLDIYVKDNIEADSFIATELFKPFGLYSIPRKGRISVGITNPPIATQDTKELTSESIMNPQMIKIGRSTASSFYNAIVYKYQEDTLEDKFLRGTITQSSDSTNRISIGNKPYNIISKGLRRGAVTQNFIDFQARRFLDRYKFGAEKIQVQTNYKTGFDIEIGDVVIFGDDALNISDITNGTRDFSPRLMEVINKDLSITDGQIKLTLLDTAFELDGRYVSVSPSSIVGSGSITTTIEIVPSYGFVGRERDKWAQYIGETIFVHSQDYSVSGETVLIGFDNVSGAMLTSPALAFSPLAGYVVGAPAYSLSTDPNEDAKWKRLHGNAHAVVNVTSGSSSTVFDVDDVTSAAVGQLVEVFKPDYSSVSVESRITDITGSTITVDTDLGFTPDNTYDVIYMGFFDGLSSYRIL